MPDQIRYDILTQQALRGVVRRVLGDAAKKGLPGEHHFFIEFDTTADGVRMSDRLRAQHPDKMTIILQHQFWDLAVNDHGFEVGLSFGGITERLAIPFEAITGFFDPSVQFGLQFEDVVETEDDGQEAPAGALGKTVGKTAGKTVGKLQDKSSDKAATPKKRFPGPAAVPPETAPKLPLPAATSPDPGPDKPTGGGEVVRLDRFRKK